jgi:hypothetical protein
MREARAAEFEIRTADHTPGLIMARNETTERLIFSKKFACPVSGLTIRKLSRACSRSRAGRAGFPRRYF